MAQLASWLPLITVLLVLAYAVAAYFLLIMPQIGPLLPGGALDNGPIKAKISDDQAYIKKLQAYLTYYTALSDENKQRAASIMPLDADNPGIIVALDAIARKNNMVLTSVDAVTDEKSVNQYGRKSVRISAAVDGGGYDQFKLFLNDVEHSLRLFDVQSIIFSPTGGYGLVMRAYFVEPKMPASASKGAPAKP